MSGPSILCQPSPQQCTCLECACSKRRAADNVWLKAARGSNTFFATSDSKFCFSRLRGTSCLKSRSIKLRHCRLVILVMRSETSCLLCPGIGLTFRGHLCLTHKTCVAWILWVFRKHAFAQVGKKGRSNLLSRKYVDSTHYHAQDFYPQPADFAMQAGSLVLCLMTLSKTKACTQLLCIPGYVT